MGPDGPQLSAVPGGVDGAVDQVKRLEAFRQRHREITITSPRQNGTTEWRALRDDSDDVAVTHHMLRFLLDYLEARFDMGTSG